MYEQELAELNSIKNSRVLRNLLAEHKEHWQKKVNEYIRQQNLIEAYGAVSRYDDADRIMGLVEQRIAEIKKGEVKKDGE